MTDLTTEAGILEWARSIEGRASQLPRWMHNDEPGEWHADRATAAKLARAMRLLEAFEAEEKRVEASESRYTQFTYPATLLGRRVTIDTLRAALEEPK